MGPVGYLSAAPPQHYISSSTGSDSNAGTKASPWAHAPGMKSCAGNCAGYTPHAGDQFILYGGDTWNINDLQLNIHWSGASGNNIVYGGEDTSWFNTAVCGNSFCRPIFDFQNTLTCNISEQVQYHCAGVLINAVSFVTIDNIEIRNFEMPNEVTQGANSGYGADPITMWGCADGLAITNNYVHDWSMAAPISSGSSGSSVISGGNGSGCPSGAPNTISGNIITDQHSQCSGCYIGGGIDADGIITNNECSYSANCIDTFSPGTVIAGNLIHDTQNSLDPANHGNAIHAQCAAYIYDNVIYNMAAGVSADLNEPRNPSCIATTPQTYYTWDNVMWNLGNQTCFEDRDYSGIVVNYYHYNDTCVAPGQSPGTVSSFAVRSVSDCSGTCGPTSITVVNMHVVSNTATSGTAPFIATATQFGTTCCWNPPEGARVSTSFAETVAAAHSNGYTTADSYAPTVSTDPTVGRGTNLAADCSQSLQSLCTALSVLGPLQHGPQRPAGGAGNWDIGAYQFASNGATPPAAPTGLTATVQ